MKTNLQKLFLLAITLFIPGFVNAASSCSYSEQVEMNDIVANVKSTYEAVDIYSGKALAIDEVDEHGNIPEVDQYVRGLKISIINITEDIYVKVSNNQDETVRTFYYKDTDNGIASFETDKTNVLTTYTIEVYANKYSCKGERFRTITLQTPQYNRFSEKNICNEYPDFYYCQEFILGETITYDTFYSQLDVFKEKKAEDENKEKDNNKTLLERIKEFYENNTKTILIFGGCIVIITGVATTVILLRKKRSRVL